MTTTPPSPAAFPPTQFYDRDAENLKLLSVFYYIVAGFHALGACLLLIYLALAACFMLFGLAAGASAGHAAHDPSASVVALPFIGMGLILVLIVGLALLLVATLGFCHFKCARSLARRKNLTLCYIMAAIICLNIPLGTVLGIFTFVVLSRPSVQTSFS